MRVPLPQVAHFADRLRVCLDSNMRPEKCVEMCSKAFQAGPIRTALGEVKERLESGSTLSQAFEPASRYLPGFFAPVIACGEEAGRLSRALRFISDHSTRLAPTAKKLRNSWLYLVMIAGGAWLISCSVQVILLGLPALGRMSATLITVGIVAGLGYLGLRNADIRRTLHGVAADLPFLGTVQKEWGLTLFTAAMAMMYGTAVPARRMVQLAVETIPNIVLGERARLAVPLVAEGASLHEALAQTLLFPGPALADIRAGEEAGELEQTFDRVAKRTSEELYVKLSAFSAIVHRIALYGAILMVVAQFSQLAAALAWRH